MKTYSNFRSQIYDLFIYLLSPDKLKSSDEDLSVACVICEGVPNRVHEPAEFTEVLVHFIFTLSGCYKLNAYIKFFFTIKIKKIEKGVF